MLLNTVPLPRGTTAMKKQFNLRHLLLTTAVVALVTWSIALGISPARRNIVANQTTYAARFVAHMCVEHMKENNQTWPRSWAELRDDYEPCLARSVQSWTFAELQERVGVDWTFDPSNLPKTPASIPMIWIAREPNFPFHGTTADEIVIRYIETTVQSGR
jgi:hypothetical protein